MNTLVDLCRDKVYHCISSFFNNYKKHEAELPSCFHVAILKDNTGLKSPIFKTTSC